MGCQAQLQLLRLSLVLVILLCSSMLSFQSLDFRCLGCRMPVSMYCQSTFLDALAKSHQPLLPGVSKYAVKAPSIWGSYTCQVSPNVLSKYQQSGGVTLILAARCSPNVLSKYQQSGGVTCWVSPNVLSKYQQSSWGSYTCFLSNLLALLPVFYHTSIFI